MKLIQIVIASAALMGAMQAEARVSRLTGASATLIEVVRALQYSCTTSGGSFKVYKTTSSIYSLGNYVTVTCTGADFDTIAAGHGVNEVRIRVSDASEFAVINAKPGGEVPTTFLVPTSACTALGFGSGRLGFLYNMFDCGTALNDWATSDGGIMDMEGPVFNASYAPADFQMVGISQVFGLAVNTTLYNALQAYQKTAAGGNIVPATCAAGDTTAACQPSLSRAQVGSLMNNDVGSAAKTAGAAYLVPGATGQIEYCAFSQYVGAQKAAELYFLGRGLDGDLGGQETPMRYGFTTAAYKISENSTSGNVRTCLNNASGYKFGVLSMTNTNQPLGGSDTYRFVRINEVAGAEGTGSADTNTRTAINGRYDFVYESMKYCPAGTCAPILDEITYVLPTTMLSGVRSGLFDPFRNRQYIGRNGNSLVPYLFR